MAKLTSLAKNCDCPLYQHKAVLRQVSTEYKPNKDGKIDVMFIAEGPGQQENVSGRPCVGMTGMILRRLIKKYAPNIGYAIGNTIRCRATRKNDIHRDRKPTNEEISACRQNLTRDIKKLKPKRIVLLGSTPAKSLAKNIDGSDIDSNAPIDFLRGKDYTVFGIPATITWHFSYVHRKPTVASVWKDDILRTVRRATGALPDYSKLGKDAVMIDTIPKLRKLLGKMVNGLTKNDIVAFDYETDGLGRVHNSILCLGFSWCSDIGYVIPLEHHETPWVGKEKKEVVRLLKKFFSLKNPSFKALVAHNLKFERMITYTQLGVPICMPTEDTMLRAHALNEERKGIVSEAYGLKTLVKEYLGFYGYEQMGDTLEARSEGSLRDVPLHELARYNAVDCYVTYRLYEFQKIWASLEDYNKLSSVGLYLHGPITDVLSTMEVNGLRVDVDQIRHLMGDTSPITNRMKEVEDEFYSLPSVIKANDILLKKAGIPTNSLFASASKPKLFHINKPDSKATLFFDVLGLDPVNTSKKTGKPSVDSAFKSRYSHVQEVMLFDEWSKLTKIHSTYIKPVYKFIHEHPDMQDGRVRPSFNPTGTITGRLSSSDPNMLNIPSRQKTEAAKAIKRLFICDPGNVLVVADYSQAEVRWLAEITGDPNLIKAFNLTYKARVNYSKNPSKENAYKLKYEGDFHRHTASMMNGVEIVDVTSEQRQAAKAIVFGLVYGMSTIGLAARLNVKPAEAEKFIRKFFDRFPKAEQWLNYIEETGFVTGRVISPTGRRKIISSWLLVGDNTDNIYKSLRSHYNYESRVCRNAPIQGVASDTNLLACAKIIEYCRAKDKKWKLINTVYDSIMIEVPYEDTKECINIARRIMESPKLFKPFGIKPKVPFAADFSVGVNWGDQYDVVEHEETWKVECNECSSTRTESEKPNNKRCESCGSKDVRIKIVEGKIEKLIWQLKRDLKDAGRWIMQ